MANTLEVQIIGDVSSLDKALKQAEKLQAEYSKSIEQTSKDLAENISISRQYAKAIDELTKSYKEGSISSKDYSTQLAKIKKDEQETAIATGDLRKELANLKKEQKELGAASQSSASGVQNLGKAGANATPTLTEFSRVIQDAPFGIQGVANNITQLTTQFGYLQKSSGGTLPALKALGGSFLGPGGLIFAVSTITSLLVSYGDELFKAKDAGNELSNEIVKNSQAEISSVNSYVAVAQNVNLSMEDRLIAVKKLQSEYPAYFGNLSKEQILNGNVTAAVRGVTQALIAKAKAAALTDKIVKLSQEEETIQSKLNETTAATFRFYKLSKQEAFDAAVVLNKQLRGEIDLVKELENGNANNLTKTEKVALAAFQYSANLRGLSKELIVNKNEQDKLTSSVEKATAAQIKLDFQQEKTKKPKKIKAPNVTPQLTSLADKLKAEDLVDIKSIEVATNEVDEFGNKISTFTDDLVDLGSIKVFTGKLDEFGNKIKGIAAFDIPPIKLRPVETSEFIDSLERAKENAKIFSDGVNASIGAVASQMATSLQTGNAVLDAFVGSVISGLAQIAQAQITGLIADQAIATTKIGTNQAVATSNAVTAASSTAAAAGPAGAFLLPALVGAAIGFIAASFAGIKFAHGGVVPGGSFTGDKVPAMLNSGEAVMNRQQQANTLMAIANGNSNALQSNRAADSFSLSTLLRGADILLAVERQKKKR